MKLSHEQKLEVGRMMQEGVSPEGIQAVIGSWASEARHMSPYARYASYVEYGKFPETNIVEGSLVRIDDTQKVLPSPQEKDTVQ